MEETKKYIIANIKIPIEIENDDIKYLNDYASVIFEIDDKLPEKTTNDINISSLLNMLQPNKNDLLENNIAEPEEVNRLILTVSNNEIKHQKTATNTSFKNRKGISSRYTRKNITNLR